MTNAAIAQGSAHVCTAEHAQGTDAMAFAGFYAPPVFRAIGLRGAELEALPSVKTQLNQLRSDVPANWPGQHPIRLSATRRHKDETAGSQHKFLSDFYHYVSDCGDSRCYAHRHDHTRNRQQWYVAEIRRDQNGHEWRRSFAAVTDDHGWLIEVPSC